MHQPLPIAHEVCMGLSNGEIVHRLPVFYDLDALHHADTTIGVYTCVRPEVVRLDPAALAVEGVLLYVSSRSPSMATYSTTWSTWLIVAVTV